jgi:hypothetical protein
MGKPSCIGEKLQALRSLRGVAPSLETTRVLRERLSDKSNVIVAAAAELAGNQSYSSVAPDLDAAFRRFMLNPAEADKLCRAKTATLQALAYLEHEQVDVFLVAALHV